MSVFKDTFTNTWACKFRYKDFSGNIKQHKKTGFTTKREASQYEIDEKPKLEGVSSGTFEAIAKQYLEHCELTQKPSTLFATKSLYRNNYLPYFGKRKVKDITKVEIHEWQLEMMKKNYSQTSLKTINSKLHAFFNYCVEYDIIKTSPMPKSIGSKKGEEMKFWTLEEFQKFIPFYKDEPMYETGFSILFFGGIRIGELLALTYRDFNFQKNTVSITKNCVITFSKTEGHKVYIQSPKTQKSIRTISLPKTVMDMVRFYFLKNFQLNENDRLFPVYKNLFNIRLDKGIKACGLKRIRLHDLRHSHASMLMNMGVPIKQISERLGHEDIETTLRTYAHLYESKENELANMLNNLMVKKA
ncbi:MAG: site-specific integrase [Spirochaetales bacterium]|nr:site-specific integrase [Candidatus Physcosoma equi]